MHSVDECVHICSSLSVEAACLIVQYTTDSECIATRFIALVYVKSICRKFFLSFLCLRERTSWTTSTFCSYPPPPPPPGPTKHHMKFFHELIELWVARCLIDPPPGISICSFFNITWKIYVLNYQTSVTCYVWIFSGIAHSSSPSWASTKLPVLVS